MLINIQAPEVANLLWELFKMIPLEMQATYAPRVDKAASLFEHPTLDGCVDFTVGGHGASKPSSAL